MDSKIHFLLHDNRGANLPLPFPIIHFLDLFRLGSQYDMPLPGQLRSTCHYMSNHYVKIWHVRLEVANNMHPLSCGGTKIPFYNHVKHNTLYPFSRRKQDSRGAVLMLLYVRLLRKNNSKNKII